MSLTRAEAEQVAKEAIAQGWEGDRHMVDLGDGSEYNEGYGRVYVHDWDEINKRREELGNDSISGGGCSVELHFPGIAAPEYLVHEREDWRKLKAKIDELAEIIKQVNQRGWVITGHPQKVGKFGMMIEVVPRGGSHAYPVRVGGMRTWRKLCREHDEMITITEHEEHEERRQLKS